MKNITRTRWGLVRGSIFSVMVVAALVSGFFVANTEKVIATNVLPSVIINEFVSHPNTGDKEWVELLNTTDSNIDLSTSPLTLRDFTALGAPNDTTLSSGIIPAMGLFVYEYSNPKLNDGGDAILLVSGSSVISAISYGNVSHITSGLETVQNISESVQGNSSAFVGSSWVMDQTPTKGWFNDAGTGGQTAPLLSTIDTTLFAGGTGIVTNIGELTNPSATPATESTGALYFEKTGKGKIVFTASLNLSDQATVAVLQGLGSAMEMSGGHIKFDSNTASAMAATGAKVYMYGLDALGYTSEPSIIVKNDTGTVIDGSGVVTSPVYSAGGPNGGQLSFGAAHFTQFDLASDVYVDDNDATCAGQTPCYTTIQAGVNAVASSGTVNVAAGTYAERIEITKPLNLIGAGIGNSIIDATSFSVLGDVIKITTLTGNTKIEGFNIQTGDYSNGITASGGTDASGKIEIKNNHIISTNSSTTDEQFGIIAGYGNLRKLIISGNQISDTYSNSILVEKQAGETEITSNTLNGAFPSIFFMTYGGLDITTLQKVDNNTIDMENADPTWYGSAITFNSARRNVPTTSLGLGKYTNISITVNTIQNLSVTELNNYKGIHLINDDPDGTGGETTGAIISNNQISGASGNNAVGIKLSGKITGTIIHDNTISGLSIGLLGVSNNNGAGTQYPSTTTLSDKNSISGNTLAVNWPSESPLLNAESNWWGTADNTAIATMIEGDVDFDPYYISEDKTILSNEELATVYVDATFTDGSADGHTFGYDAFVTIQAGINAVLTGGTVNVAAGTYNESVLMENPVTLLGAGSSDTVITGLASGQSYVVKVDGTTDVMFDGVGIDGGGTATGENSFTYGILINSSGDSDNPVIIKNSSVKNIWQNGSNGIGVEDGSYALVHNTTISSFHKRGIRFIDSEGKFYNNEVIGDNVDGTSRVQNLLNLWGGSSVEIYSNKLHNALTTGDTPTWDSPGIFISSYGGNGASHADVHDNEIYNSDTGIVIGSVYADIGDSSSATVTGNDFHDLNWGINFEQSTGSAVVNENSFSNITKALSADADGDPITGPEIDATRNWWGSATSTDIEVLIYTGVTFDPWYINAGMTTLSDGDDTDAVYTSTTEGEADLPEDVTEVELTDDTVLNLSAGLNEDDEVILQSGVEGEDIVLTNADLDTVTVNIPDGTLIQGPDGWDGIIEPPTEGTPAGGNAPAGFSVGSVVISVGSPDGTLVFDEAVTILLEGVTGTVGYRPSGSDTWQTITNVCGENYASPTPPTAPGECAISNGTDTKIVTYHFTSFGSLNTVSSGGGGGGSSGTVGIQVLGTPTPTPTPSPTPQGQVLGEAITRGNPANLTANGLKEGDTVSARGSSDPDVYIVNQFGYKRLFLNPVIFNMYGHLKAGWNKVKNIISSARDSFPTSGLFRNCETNLAGQADLKVYALATTGEDTAVLHWVNITGDQAVAQDPEFFKKVFCINSNEFNWYAKSSTDFTSLSQVPTYSR